MLNPSLYIEPVLFINTAKAELPRGCPSLFSIKYLLVLWFLNQVDKNFLTLSFVIGISFLGFSVLLYTRISLNKSIVFPLTMVLVLPFVWTILYFLGKIGKDTGKKQMKKLHDFMLDVINI